MTGRCGAVASRAGAIVAACVLAAAGSGTAQAGDVRVVRVGSDVFIRGGTDADGVTLSVVTQSGDLLVQSDGPESEIDVRPRDTIYVLLDGGGNSVDIQSLPRVRRVVVIGGSGDDSLTLSGANMPTDVHFDGQGGDDTLTFEDTNTEDNLRPGLTGDLVAILGEGWDNVFISGGVVGGSCILELGSGELTGSGASNSVMATGAEFAASLTVVGGADADRVELSAVSVRHSTRIDLGKGMDTLRVTDGSRLRGGLVCDMGDEGDTGDGDDTRRGADSVNLGPATVGGRLKLGTGDGPDTVVFSGLTALRRVTVDLGVGADSLTFGATFPSRVPFASRFDGGLGPDELSGEAPLSAEVLSFEIL